MRSSGKSPDDFDIRANYGSSVADIYKIAYEEYAHGLEKAMTAGRYRSSNSEADFATPSSDD